MPWERGGLTADEARALGMLPVPVDLSRVRLDRGGGGPLRRVIRGIVLRLSGRRGIALGNHVFLPDHCCRSLPVLAHELTHCGQYQAWGPLRYFARGAAERWRELRHRRGGGSSPYDYTAEPAQAFEAYGMEQQGQIVEDWLRGCPRAAARIRTRAAGPPTERRHCRPDP